MTRVVGDHNLGECSGQNVSSDELRKSEEGTWDVHHISPVGDLLADLEALPVLGSQLSEGPVKEVAGESRTAAEDVSKEDITVMVARTKDVEKANKMWHDIPYRSQPSLDDPEVTKVSFDVNSISQASGGATVSPSRFKLLEDLEEDEEDDSIEEGEMKEDVEEEDVRVSDKKNASQAAIPSSRTSVKSGKGGGKVG
ncbi:hypothetical protein Bca4012_058628 [Brassica carinata]